MVVGWVNIVVVGLGGFLVRSYSILLWVILFLLTLTLMSAGAFLSWRGRQYAAQASAESVITDTKPHLLYLRPFRSDSTTTKEVRRAQLVASEEEQLADVLRPFGELVAIGRPGESLPTPGAARIYTSDEEWKDVVKRQMQTARLVVIMAALGENVLWELTQAVATLEPQKVLIMILEMKAEDYESFRAKATPILGVSLPERATLWRFARREPEMWSPPKLSGFISFATDWKPSFLAPKAPYFRSDVYESIKIRAKYALRPVFESFGLEWQPPPFRVSQVFLLILSVFVGVVAVAVILLMLLGWWLGALN
jgi:hypothetical protein